MNVPKPLTLEVEPKTVRSKDIECFIRTIYTDCSRAYRILRHVLSFRSLASLRKRLVNWRRDREVVWSRCHHVPHHLLMS